MSSDVQAFAVAAKDFCAWAEDDAHDHNGQVIVALKHLANLYHCAWVLPDVFDEQDPPDLADEDWKRVFARFGSMPFNYYSQCFDPQALTDEPTVADLADDLADIWRDLKRGLMLFESGNPDAACWQWRESFQSHWGRHATGALHALQSWLWQHGAAESS